VETLTQVGKVVPVRTALAQEQQLRQRGAMPGLETHGVGVGGHRAVQVAFAFQQSGELHAQRRRLWLARECGIQRRTRPRHHPRRHFELGLDARIGGLGRHRADGAACGIEGFQHATLRLQCQREVVPPRRVSRVRGDCGAGRGLCIGEAAQTDLPGREIGANLRRIRSQLCGLLQRVDGGLAAARGVEHQREVRPGVGRAGLEFQRCADAFRSLGDLAGLEQHDARVVQGGCVVGVGGEYRVVAQEGFAQLALLMKAVGALEFGTDAHRCSEGEATSPERIVNRARLPSAISVLSRRRCQAPVRGRRVVARRKPCGQCAAATAMSTSVGFSTRSISEAGIPTR
jgi:hypothetical protein